MRTSILILALGLGAMSCKFTIPEGGGSSPAETEETRHDRGEHGDREQGDREQGDREHGDREHDRGDKDEGECDDDWKDRERDDRDRDERDHRDICDETREEFIDWAKDYCEERVDDEHLRACVRKLLDRWEAAREDCDDDRGDRPQRDCDRPGSGRPGSGSGRPGSGRQAPWRRHL